MSLLRMILDRLRDDPRAVSRVAASGDPYEFPRLLSMAVSRHPDTARAAAAAIRAHLGTLSPRRLAELDERIRHRFWWISYQEGETWHRIRPGDVARLAALGVEPLGLASFHTSGYVREAAVRELAAIRDGSELPFLLIRLRDWVEPVRRLAYDAVRERMTPGYAHHFVHNLWLVLRLEWAERTDHAPFVADVRALLTGPGRAAVTDGLSVRDLWLRRACFALLLDPPGGDAEEIVTRALRDDDHVIVLRALRRASDVLPEERMRETLRALARNPYILVRREALATWARLFPDTAEPELRRALLDPTARVRRVAREGLALPPEAYRDVYLAALDGARGARLRAALYGLGEQGSKDDAGVLLPYLSAREAGVRRAAVTSLGWLGTDASTPLLVNALADPSPGVSRAARWALEMRASRLEAEPLWTLAADGAAPHVRRNALLLIARIGKWESIAYLVRAQAKGDHAISHLAGSRVKRWIDHFNRSGTQPTKEQLARAAQAVDEAAPTLGKERTRMLRFLMKDTS